MLIRCIDSNPSLDSLIPSLTYDKVYEVSNDSDMLYDKHIMVKDDGGYYELYYRRRFVLLSDERNDKLESIGII